MKQPLIIIGLTLLMAGMVHLELKEPFREYKPFRFLQQESPQHEDPRAKQTLQGVFLSGDEPGQTLLALFLALQIIAPLAYIWKNHSLKAMGWSFLFLAITELVLMILVWGMMRFILLESEVIYLWGYYLILLGGGLACAMFAHAGWEIAGKKAWYTLFPCQRNER